MKRLLFFILLFFTPLAYAKTLTGLALNHQAAILQTGSTFQFSATCTYSDDSRDDCSAAGGARWSTSRSSALTVSNIGLATWVTGPAAGVYDYGYVIVTAGILNDRATVYGQHIGDTWYQYPTPDYRNYSRPDVTIGSTVTIGSGVEVNRTDTSVTAEPFQNSCNWSSSDPTKATVDRHGQVTALAAGSVTITCGREGNGIFGDSSINGWQAPGNIITLNIVAGGTGNKIWYVRPDGGSIYNASTSPTGLCDGLSNLPATRAAEHHCAVDNLRDLWADGVTPYQERWVISGGDTVIVAPTAAGLGYNMNLDSASPYQDTTPGPSFAPINCNGDPNCTMPPIPSGTAGQHTKILGANYASCHSDSAKTQLNVSYAGFAGINVGDSQFVDVACFEITDKAQCAVWGAFTHACNNDGSNWGKYGISSTALASQVNISDVFIHGVGQEAWIGATGVGVVLDHVHIKGVPFGGLDMDDGPWGSSNISVAGGLTMNYSTTEFVGCIEEYPVVHNYPYIECRDQNTGAYGDGLGTGSTVGAWSFDHDLWFANFQDGLDLLHSGMQSLSVTNSQSIANDGQSYKIGSADTVVFRNNVSIVNCDRVGSLFGDEPASAIVPGVNLCRAAGDGLVFHFTDLGSYTVQNNTFIGYNATPFDLICEDAWDFCSGASSVFQNNVVLGYIDPDYNSGIAPGLFYTETGNGQVYPANYGWSVRDHNLYYGVRPEWCPLPLQIGETCNTANPSFTGQPASPISAESQLDNFNFSPSASSPLIGAGISIPGLLSDITGLTRPLPPSIGAVEVGAGPPASIPSTSQLIVAIAPSPVEVGQEIVITVSAASVGGVIPTGSISFLNGPSLLGTATLDSTGVARLSLSSLAAGTYAVTASYSGDANYTPGVSSTVALTVKTSTPPPPVIIPPPPVITPPPPVIIPPPTVLSIKIGQPNYGFNVIPGSTRRIFATVTNGTTNQVTWSVKSGSAQISSTSGSWIDVTAPANGSSCSYTGTSAQYGVSSATRFTIEAISVDDRKKTASATFNVCKPAVEVSIVPFYRTLYANQPADVQSLVLGSVNQNVHWAITSQPRGGDGKLTDSTSRDTLFTGTAPGRYELTAISVANTGKSATAIMYVTGHEIPYRVTPNQTEPVDCTVDPSMLGTVYEVGPSQTFKTLASVPFSTIAPGSTVRLHNEDTSGLHPTVYHEYLEISQPATAEQPFRMCGVPDAKGNLPIIDGANATGDSDTSRDGDGYGLLTIHNFKSFAYWPKFIAAQYIAIEGVQFRNAKPGYSYGAKQNWQDSAACIHISEVQNAAFVGNDIGSCGNGVLSDFNSNGGWGSSDLNILWEGNHIHNNGIAGSKLDHQMNLQSWGNVVQFNRIDNYTTGALGANIKSRGLQDIFRYNYLGDGAQREMDLVDVKDAPAYMSFAGFLGGGANSFHAQHSNDSYPADQIAAEQEAWNSHFVYGNIYLNSTSTVPIHFSMDTSGGELARKGSLYWYNNTFYEKACSTCSASLWTLFDTTGGNGTYYSQAEFQTVQAYNNIIWMNNTVKHSFQWNNYSAFIGVGGGNLLPSNWGSDLMTGGTGSGWSTGSMTDAYQNSLPLDPHVSGFDKSDIATTGSIPFDNNSWTLASQMTATQSVPSAVCEMPTRFAYLANLGYAVPRTSTPNVGATDTVAETADLINQTAGSGRYNTRYSNCN